MNIKRGKISKARLALGLAASLLVPAGMANAAGQAAVLTNDTVIEAGEELGATLVLNGDGRYDVYAAVTGGALGPDIYVFGPGGALIKWEAPAPIPKLLENADLANMPVADKIIRLFPKMPLGSELAGTYTFYGALSTSGQLDFPVIDQVSVEVK
ncbi:MAG: hypothetical protein GY862_36685 [Gammaproteobacteria bacterium]|nr:hypothetical protein [Gammaproteobacteria bacterium]